MQGRESLDFSDVRFWLNDPDQFNGGAGAVIKPDGSLTIESVPEGVYQIGVAGRPPGFSPDSHSNHNRERRSIFEKGFLLARVARGVRWKLS